jgi:hypothetical protein
VLATSDGEADPGDGGRALDAFVYEPSDVAVDAEGNVYIADSTRGRIRRIDREPQPDAPPLDGQYLAAG